MTKPEVCHDHIQNVLAMAEEDRAFSDAQIEREIQAKGMTAPRVSLADIEGAIESEWYFTAAQGVDQAYQGAVQPELVPGPLCRLTFCVLVMRNGFTVTGESACVSAENFDAELGRKIARQNAIDKCWPLFGFHLAAMQHGPLFHVPPQPA